MTCFLAGCSSASSMNPVNWWHRAEGGKIAEQRPAPPGADAPYPNLSTVPAKPTPPNMEELKKLTDSLVADRTNAQHAAQAAPLADPSSPSASPSLFGVGTAPPPPPVSASAPPAGGAPGAAEPPAGGPGVASASMPAAAAPPPPPAPAPRKPVQSAPLTAPAAPAATQAAAPATSPATPSTQTNTPSTSGAAPTTQATTPAASGATPAVTGAAAAVPEAPPPDLPAAPPPRPAAAGPAPVAAPGPPPMPAAVPSATAASIVFVEGSTTLSPPAADEVKAFAGKRGKGVIVVTGYGDAASSDPAAQSAALSVGVARAAAIADALKADGVPASAVRVNAEASGRGASLRLLQ